MKRCDGRARYDLREISIERNFTMHAEGAVLVSFGNTKVLCTATVEDKVPRFLKGTGSGWVTAEYALLPRATHTRVLREVIKGKQSGRTLEIQRLIGRSLRASVDLSLLGEKTITLDCDVLQADGGTRTAAITGAFVALVDAVSSYWNGEGAFPVKEYVAAISVGMDQEGVLLDLNYKEDSAAAVDMNVVMTGSKALVEVQGTGEGKVFTREEMDEMLNVAEQAISSIITIQKEALKERAKYVGLVRDTVVVATKNAGKIREFNAALSKIGMKALPLHEVDASIPDVEETRHTFMENAILKAEYYAKMTGTPALADDSGLSVEALGGAPGVYSARYAGVHGDDAANNQKLIAEIQSIPEAKRKGRYVCALALVYPEGNMYTAEGHCDGYITREARGEGGFGYDPHFYLPWFDKTMAELSLDEKNKISHRGKAIGNLVRVMQEAKESE